MHVMAVKMNANQTAPLAALSLMGFYKKEWLDAVMEFFNDEIFAGYAPLAFPAVGVGLGALIGRLVATNCCYSGCSSLLGCVSSFFCGEEKPRAEELENEAVLRQLKAMSLELQNRFVALKNERDHGTKERYAQAGLQFVAYQIIGVMQQYLPETAAAAFPPIVTPVCVFLLTGYLANRLYGKGEHRADSLTAFSSSVSIPRFDGRLESLSRGIDELVGRINAEIAAVTGGPSIPGLGGKKTD